MMLQGEKAMTTSELFRSLVDEARRLERGGRARPRGKDSGGHDLRRLRLDGFAGYGMSVMITADRSRAAAQAAAVHLARQVWRLASSSPTAARPRTGGGRQPCARAKNQRSS